MHICTLKNSFSLVFLLDSWCCTLTVVWWTAVLIKMPPRCIRLLENWNPALCEWSFLYFHYFPVQVQLIFFHHITGSKCHNFLRHVHLHNEIFIIYHSKLYTEKYFYSTFETKAVQNLDIWIKMWLSVTRFIYSASFLSSKGSEAFLSLLFIIDNLQSEQCSNRTWHAPCLLKLPGILRKPPGWQPCLGYQAQRGSWRMTAAKSPGRASHCPFACPWKWLPRLPNGCSRCLQ